MSCTPRAWKSSPEWLAAASASSSPSSGSPARSITAACSGLFADRGKTGVLALPAVNANVPSAASAATAPRCRDSTKPDRTTSASTGFTATSAGDNCSEGHRTIMVPCRPLGAGISMRAVVQRVTQASVTVDGQVTGAIDEGAGPGLLVPRRRHLRGHHGHSGQTRQEALGPAHPRRREDPAKTSAPRCSWSASSPCAATRTRAAAPPGRRPRPGPVAEPLVNAVIRRTQEPGSARRDGEVRRRHEGRARQRRPGHADPGAVTRRNGPVPDKEEKPQPAATLALVQPGLLALRAAEQRQLVRRRVRRAAVAPPPAIRSSGSGRRPWCWGC